MDGTLMVDGCHYMLVGIHGMHNTESEPPCKLQTLGDYDMSAQIH